MFREVKDSKDGKDIKQGDDGKESRSVTAAGPKAHSAVPEARRIGHLRIRIPADVLAKAGGVSLSLSCHGSGSVSF